MIFESLWPFALLLAVPVVIILYLLKPRGKDHRISSTLLWEILFKNQQSKTFLEKFVHNILMYLQILIILLLVLALMSPYIRRQGNSGGSMVLVLDTSASMQHDAGSGKTRLEEAVEQAKSLIAASEGTSFSIVTNDCMGTELLAVGIKDKGSLYEALDQAECCDGAGDLSDAESVVETLLTAADGSGKEPETAQVVVFTDGIGASKADGLAEHFDARVLVTGKKVSNVANNFLSYTENSSQEANTASLDGEDLLPQSGVESGRNVVCASSITNYSDAEANMEVSLYEGDRLLEIKHLTLGAGETTLCFFEEFLWRGEALRSEIGSVVFEGGEEKDSLAGDNVAYVVPDQANSAAAVLIGSGNTYLEKAYQAAFGMSLTKVENESGLSDDTGTNAVRIYDAGEDVGGQEQADALVFGDVRNASGSAERVMLSVTGCDLTSGLSSFSIGVNETKVYDVPEWGTGFLWAGKECAGYYGEHDGVRTVVVGFDIRESDFPLKAEFPVFISNALRFLGDTSLLAENVYEAGETVLFHPQADIDVNTLTARTKKAGLYEVEAKDRREQYVVRFATSSQSDGQIAAESIGSDFSYREVLVKQSLRKAVLLVALILLILEWILYVRQMRYHGKFYLVVRLICGALVLCALLGISVSVQRGLNTTVFLVDISNSNEQNLSKMESYLRSKISEMPGNNQYGIVTFGKDSLVEQFLTKENQFSQIMSLPDKTATNFEDAISRALAMIPADAAARVVILTDGKETKGDLTATASALVSRQIELLACVYDVAQGQDAYVENVQLPSYLYQGDAYDMTVTVESNYDTDAQIQIWTGSIQTQAYDVHLNRGVNRFQFRQTVTGENVESFEVRVAAAGDTCAENNSYHAYSVVESAPKVLLVTGMEEDSRLYEQVLDSAGCVYNRISAINAPDSLEELLQYKSILLENVYLSDLPEGFLANIETYVKDYGCGLICLGGEESYALGGYRDSVLETVLPVDMELRGVNEIPSMAMIMVIDHSGSMSTDAGNGATNLDLAVEAAKNAVDQMRDTDQVGVLMFDDQYSWVVEPVSVSDREGIKEKIDTIAEGGGTTIQPALWEAYRGVMECDASIRHVILLTDGQGESKNYSDIVSSYQEGQITLSAVAVGADSDTRLLQQLAKDCGGRYYYSDMASDIPKIFAQEVFLSGDTYLQNGTFDLSVNRSSQITEGLFEAGWPKLYGYVSATPKAASNVLIASNKDDPVLTLMQYGLGHTVAWNTDVTNRWTAGYAGEDDYVQLWKRIIDYSVGNAAIGEDSVDVMTAGGLTSVVYHAQDYGQQTKVEAVYTDPEGNTFTQPLQAAAPGRYEAKLDTDITGLYQLSVRRIDDGSITNAVTTAAAVQYSDEYKFGRGNTDFTNFVERYGRLTDEEESIWNQRKSGLGERYELTKWLILLAVLWFLMDIAFRRFQFRPADTRLYRSAREKLQRIRQTSLSRTREDPYPQNDKGETTRRDAVAENAGPDAASLTFRDAPADVSGTQKADKKKLKKDKKEKTRPQTQSLDTSALLKKKDQRNQ